ncbi:MAG: TIGR02444 family protein [Porticoccaceae bacterium]
MGGALADDFWAFSLALYSRPRVAECCLRLQDDAGANVNLLLFCCWAGRRGMALDAQELAAAAATIEDWQLRVLRPLRARRRTPGIAAAEKQRLLAEELIAERHEQALLVQWLEDCGSAPGSTPDGDACARENLTRYCATLGVALERDNPLLIDEPHESG